MKDSFIHKTRWFWAWQDEEEEAWLRQMALDGFHLVNPGFFGQYTFRRGEEKDVVYRLDFIHTKMKNETYFQLFQDAGWEHVGEMGGWQYWRTVRPQGKEAPQIFTDNESKAQKYRRVLLFAAIFIPLLSFNAVNLGRLDANSFYNFFSILLFILLLVYIYVCMRILLRIRTLRQL